MLVSKRLFNILVSLSMLVFMITLAAVSTFAFAASKDMAAGSTWIVDKTTALTDLTIAAGAVIKAHEGKSVTMTVDGIEKEIKPGVYKGNVVLTVTKEIQNPVMMGGPEGESGVPTGAGGGVPGGGGPSGGSGLAASNGVRAAIYIDGGKYVQEKSVAASVTGGKVTDSSATDVNISSTGKDFNGIIVSGESTYTINNLKIIFNGGDQGNNGAAVTTGGKADVTINKASIISRGVQRAAVVVGGNSIVHVNDSDIEAYDGTLPDKFAKMEDSNSMEVPWVLGFIGNNRATNVVENGTAYYNNTHVKTQRWGCLSTDAVKSVKLYAVNCRLEAIESGYGAYSDGEAYDSFSKCTFDVKDYGLIMTGGTGIFSDGCLVNSGRFGVMFHGNGILNIDKGCVFNTKKAVIQVKSAGPTIVVDNAKLNPENGIILEAIVNDDPWKVSGPPGGGSGMPGGAPGGAAGGRSGGMPEKTEGIKDVTATFKSMTMKGDIVTSMTRERNVNINFEKAAITGAITTATSKSQADIDGVKLNKKTYYYIGEVKNAYCAVDDKYGIKVSLDKNSSWEVDKTSYLTELTIADGGVITAPKGSKVTMTVDGQAKEIKAGMYKGKIVLTVVKS